MNTNVLNTISELYNYFYNRVSSKDLNFLNHFIDFLELRLNFVEGQEKLEIENILRKVKNEKVEEKRKRIEKEVINFNKDNKDSKYNKYNVTVSKEDEYKYIKYKQDNKRPLTFKEKFFIFVKDIYSVDNVDTNKIVEEEVNKIYSTKRIIPIS